MKEGSSKEKVRMLKQGKRIKEEDVKEVEKSEMKGQI